MRRMTFDPNRLKGVHAPRGPNSVSHAKFLEMMEDAVAASQMSAEGRQTAVCGKSMLCMLKLGMHDIKLPPGLTLWAGGYNCTNYRSASYLYGCVVQSERAAVLWKAKAFHRKASVLAEPALTRSMMRMLYSAEEFPAVVKEMGRKRVDSLEKARLMNAAARDKVIAYSRIEGVVSGHDADVDETAWSMAMKFHEALDRGPAVINHLRSNRLEQMWRFQKLLMSKTKEEVIA